MDNHTIDWIKDIETKLNQLESEVNTLRSALRTIRYTSEDEKSIELAREALEGKEEDDEHV